MGGFAGSWRLVSRVRMRAKKEETKLRYLGWNGAKRNARRAYKIRQFLWAKGNFRVETADVCNIVPAPFTETNVVTSSQPNFGFHC